MWSEKNYLFKVDRKNAVTTKLELKTAQHEALSYGANMSVIFAIFPSCGRLKSSPSVSAFFPISEFSYFVIRFLNQIFFCH